ncbi:MAG TPA: polysaccharide biosynthesis/export family protein [Alloacidobacterium sp.]|nr:polysaccharide biosynthesis/export family protein [Alloacidobacterium sp.]
MKTLSAVSLTGSTSVFRTSRFIDMKLLAPAITTSIVMTTLLLGSITAHAQQAENAAHEANAPQLKVSPLKALQNFEPPADEEYEIGPGDEITIDVAGYPELTGKRTVGPDGRITLPVTGSIQIANETREKAAATIQTALEKYYSNPSVTIGIDKYGSNRILILGNVQHPGVLTYDSTPTLLDAIARGGLLANANGRDAIPERCIIYRGNDQTLTVELKQLLQSGSAMADIRLRRNDIVFVPVQQQEFISVLGAVQHPGPEALTPELNLRLALAQAGGLAEGAGSSPTIHIVQTSTNRTIAVPFKDLLKPHGGEEVTLHAGDTIYIPTSGMQKFTSAVSKLGPLATLVTVGVLAP